MATTSILTLRAADWKHLRDEVNQKIDLLEHLVNTLDPSPVNDKIADDLVLPCMKYLAAFCTAVKIEPVCDEDETTSHGLKIEQ